MRNNLWGTALFMALTIGAGVQAAIPASSTDTPTATPSDTPTVTPTYFSSPINLTLTAASGTPTDTPTVTPTATSCTATAQAQPIITNAYLATLEGTAGTSPEAELIFTATNITSSDEILINGQAFKPHFSDLSGLFVVLLPANLQTGV
jgi:hypothetical protein